MKIILIELDLQCSMVTHLISTHSHLDFFLPSEVVTTWQTDSAAHKLKPRSFHKSAQVWVHLVDFHPGVNCAWHRYYLIDNIDLYIDPLISLLVFSWTLNLLYSALPYLPSSIPQLLFFSYLLVTLSSLVLSLLTSSLYFLQTPLPSLLFFLF